MKICQSQIHRWHPHFKVNEVPDLELSSLPQPPIIKGCTSAADLIMNNRGNLAPKVNNALCCAAKKSSLMENSVDNNISGDTQISGNLCETKITNSKLKGVSSSILERIRQKEQKMMQLTMTRDPEKEEKLSKMQRLPEICRILKSYFISERKVAITLEDCVQKLFESFGTSIKLQSLGEHVRLLAELVPEWLTIAMVRRFPFVKLAKGYDINKVMKTLNNLRLKESET